MIYRDFKAKNISNHPLKPEFSEEEKLIPFCSELFKSRWHSTISIYLVRLLQSHDSHRSHRTTCLLVMTLVTLVTLLPDRQMVSTMSMLPLNVNHFARFGVPWQIESSYTGWITSYLGQVVASSTCTWGDPDLNPGGVRIFSLCSFHFGPHWTLKHRGRQLCAYSICGVTWEQRPVTTPPEILPSRIFLLYWFFFSLSLGKLRFPFAVTQNSSVLGNHLWPFGLLCN